MYNVAPLRLKSGPDPVQMRPSSNPMRQLFVLYVCLSSLASKSGCSGLLIHTRLRGHRFRSPLSPPPRGLHKSIAPQKEPSRVPPPPPRKIRLWPPWLIAQLSGKRQRFACNSNDCYSQSSEGLLKLNLERTSTKFTTTTHLFYVSVCGF